jgi:hypothetical protein
MLGRIFIRVAPTELPVQLTDDLLKRLFVPEQFWQVLKNCRTLDDLTNAEIPNELRDRVFDCVAQPNFDRVLNQPDFITGSTDDLLKFTEGELLGFLLKLNPEQEKYVNWAINTSGPSLLKGGPGTGKSTVALYRTRAILEILAKSRCFPTQDFIYDLHQCFDKFLSTAFNLTFGR